MIVKMGGFQSKLGREIGVGVALVSDGDLVLPIEVSDETRE